MTSLFRNRCYSLRVDGARTMALSPLTGAVIFEMILLITPFILACQNSHASGWRANLDFAGAYACAEPHYLIHAQHPGRDRDDGFRCDQTPETRGRTLHDGARDHERLVSHVESVVLG